VSIAIATFDHIVLCVKDVAATCAFYEKHPDMAAREERPGKYSIHFGYNKISLQDEAQCPLSCGTRYRAAGISAC